MAQFERILVLMLRAAIFLCAILGAMAVAQAAIKTPLVTLAAQGVGTINSPTQQNPYGQAATCVFNQTAAGGTPSTTFSIQNVDPASGLWYSVVTSAPISAVLNTPTPIAAGKGLQATANVSSSLPVSSGWRVSVTVGGSTPAVTGTIGCSLG